MRIATRCARGARESNDDAVATAGRTVLVADGMGGHRGGAAAAATAIGAALPVALAPRQSSLADAFARAGAAVRQLQIDEPDYSEAGCTLTIVAIRLLPMAGVTALVGHLGDSPAFLLREGEMELLTPPHTVAEQLRSEGRITAEEATRHPGRSTLSRVVGGITAGAPDFTEIELREGDRLLIASDGLLDVPDRRRLRSLATAAAPVDEIADALLGYALEHSGDNITIAVIDPWQEEATSSGRHDG